MTNDMAVLAHSLAPTADRLLYDRKSAAQLLSISVRSLDYLIANKVVATRRIGSRVLIAFTELKRVAKQDRPLSVLKGKEE